MTCNWYNGKDGIKLTIMHTRFQTFIKTFICLTCVLITHGVYADICPSVTEIKYRLISRDYEWTVDEGVTLDDVITVEKLFAVSIENNGEFVSCKYKKGDEFLKLDGLPVKKKCLLTNSSGDWFTTGTNRLVCNEKDFTLCVFETDCTKKTDN